MKSSPDLDTLSDEQLVQVVAQRGADQSDAWSHLIARLNPRLFAVARSFAIDAATAEDLVQVAWLRLLERGDQLREPGSIRPWLCMIVRNEARKLVTRRRAIPVDKDWDRVVDTDRRAPGDDLIDAELSIGVRLAFSGLDAPCQQLLRLTLADPPLSYDEIAAVTGRPRGSLGPTRRRCLDQLRRLLPPGVEP